MTDLKTTNIKTGFGGAGNKGSVVMRFVIDDTPIFLANCHLMSGKKKGKQRLEELKTILDSAFSSE